MEDYEYKSLTETIEYLKSNIENLKWWKENYRDRISKALSYIETKLDPTGDNVSGSDLPYVYIEDLVDILKGENNENN